MRSVVTKVIVNGLAIWVATLVVPGVSVEADSLGRTVLSLVVIGAVFGILNAVVKPVVKLLTLPFYVLSLGLMAFVVNAAMLSLAGWLSERIGFSFDPGPFLWSTVAAAVVVTLVSMVLHLLLPDGD